MPVILTKEDETVIRKALADRVNAVLDESETGKVQKRAALRACASVMYKLGPRGRTQYMWILEEVDRLTDRRGGDQTIKL
jgi:hypothetical protein